MDFSSLMNKFRKFHEWHNFSDAIYDMLQNETSMAVQIKDLLAIEYPSLTASPDFAEVREIVKRVYTSITKTNCSAAFMSSDLEHLFRIHEAFEVKRTEMRNLEKALEIATRNVLSIHSRLVSLQQTSDKSDEIMSQQRLYDTALEKEEQCRLEHDEQKKVYEVEFNSYQSEFVQSITALLGEMAKIRVMHDKCATDLATNLAKTEVSFDIQFSETKEQIEREVRRLKRIVSQTEERMSQVLTVRECDSDDDLVVIGTNQTNLDLTPDSSDNQEDDQVFAPQSISVTVSQIA